MKYVIIGNSVAAIGAIEGIRKKDKEGEITLISKEGYHTYSRPLISYLLQGKTDLERMKYRPYDFYKNMRCDVRLNEVVSKIKPKEQEVVLEGGEVVSYDKLLVATGSRPFIPRIEGLEHVSRKFTFMDLDSAKALQSSIDKESKVLVVGAGLIGLKCAEALTPLVDEVIVCDIAEHVLSSILDEETGKLLQNHLEREGIRFYLKNGVEKFEPNKAYLQDGTIIDFHILVLAVGVVPNIELVKQAGGKTYKGIWIDEYCQTSLENIYAAGDCTESIDLIDGKQKILAIIPNAYRQGECAGINMALGHQIFDKAIPMNAIGFYGLHLVSGGTHEGEGLVTKDNSNYKKLIIQDNLLKGFIMIGDVENAGIYTSMIREQIPLSSLDFQLMKEKPQLLAFPKAYRDEKLGGRKNAY